MKLSGTAKVLVHGLVVAAAMPLIIWYAAFLDKTESGFLVGVEVPTPPVGGPTVIVRTQTPTPTPIPTPVPTQDATAVPEGPEPTSVPEVTEPQLEPTPGLTPQVGVSVDLAGLQEVLAGEITSYEKKHGANLAIAVTDLQTGERISVGGNETHRTGCVANFFGLLSLVDYLDSNEADPDPYEADVLQGISGSLPHHVARFLTASYGSTDAGVMAGQRIIGEIGLADTVYGNVPGYPADDASPNFRRNQITAADANLVLEALWKGNIFSPAWTGYTLTRMREVANWGLRYIIPGQLPGSAIVAHKIGYFLDGDGWVQNNIGIVTFTGDDGTEKAYAISFLSEKGPTEYGAAFFGSYLSKLVWDFFLAKY